jgi:hypothetical protein
MADTTINQLTVAPFIVSSLLLPVSDGSSTYKLSVANVNSLAPVQSVAGRTGTIVLTKTDVGLSLVEDKTSATIRSEITSGNVTTALGFTPYNATNPNAYITNTNASVAKAWVSFTGTGAVGACPMVSFYNVSAVNQTANAAYTINFTPGALSDANYLVMITCRNQDDAAAIGYETRVVRSTSQVSIGTYRIDGNGIVKPTKVHVVIFGA